MINLQALPCCDFAPAISGMKSRAAVMLGLPHLPVIYFACGLGDEVFYIGECENLLRRFCQHHKWPQFRNEPSMMIYWIDASSVCPATRFEMERQLIRVYRPRLNKRGVWNSRQDFKVTSDLLGGLQAIEQALGADFGVGADDEQ